MLNASLRAAVETTLLRRLSARQPSDAATLDPAHKPNTPPQSTTNRVAVTAILFFFRGFHKISPYLLCQGLGRPPWCSRWFVWACNFSLAQCLFSWRTSHVRITREERRVLRSRTVRLASLGVSQGVAWLALPRFCSIAASFFLTFFRPSCLVCGTQKLGRLVVG